MDEETPHLHLVFIPIVHTQDENGNNIDKIACSEFWKAKDSYIQLQNAFHSYITENGFDLERGKSSSREHLSVKDFKEITNYEKSKKTLEDIEIELPTVPDIKDFNKLMLGRDEKIQKEIIEPKDKIIEKLYSDNKKLHCELEKQLKIIDKAEKLENENKKILNEKVILKDKYDNLEKHLNKKYDDLLKETLNLYKIINTLEKTLKKFITWICKKFSNTEEEDLIRKFQQETYTFINPEKQIKYEEAQSYEELEY